MKTLLAILVRTEVDLIKRQLLKVKVVVDQQKRVTRLMTNTSVFGLRCSRYQVSVILKTCGAYISDLS